MEVKRGAAAALALTAAAVAFCAGVMVGRSGGREAQVQPVITALRDPAAGEAHIIDINTADVAELTDLPGIGEVLARRIVEYRETHGDFKSTGELMNVEGIGEGIYAVLSEFIKAG